ncbi:MAG: hypothetical protein EP343_24295 [Deltaproteobacteria bacterium]|nr:MAG: hypothetical protein EP343_24295 [Deltaproteobacteria bacterium]
MKTLQGTKSSKNQRRRLSTQSLVLLLLGLWVLVPTFYQGCLPFVERLCNDNSSCQLTKEPSVCFQGKCIAKVCDAGTTEACYSEPNEGTKTEGIGSCKAGQRICINNGSAWSKCVGMRQPIAEICDTADNDCDGQVDEDLDCGCRPMEHRACFTGPANAVRKAPSPCRDGRQFCVLTNGKWTWGACQHQILPGHDIDLVKGCILRDTDCDGKVDEGLLPCPCEKGAQRSCYSLSAAGPKAGTPCAKGNQNCVEVAAGVFRWGLCESERLPQVEEQDFCNKADDDCDGIIDNATGTNVPLWQACGDLQSKTACTIEVCGKDGLASSCKDQELCSNQQDDNCDGSVDEATCEKLP